jgi:hypothetical protein
MGPVECGAPERQDVRIIEFEPTSRPIESIAGQTDIYWRITHGCGVKPNPLARVTGTRIVIDPNVDVTGRRGCPIQKVFRTRIPNLPPGSYDLVMGANTFHVQVP